MSTTEISKFLFCLATQAATLYPLSPPTPFSGPTPPFVISVVLTDVLLAWQAVSLRAIQMFTACVRLKPFTCPPPPPETA